MEVYFSKHLLLHLYAHFFHIQLIVNNSNNQFQIYAPKMALGETIRRSYECLPLLSIFLCVKNNSSKDRYL